MSEERVDDYRFGHYDSVMVDVFPQRQALDHTEQILQFARFRWPAGEGCRLIGLLRSVSLNV